MTSVERRVTFRASLVGFILICALVTAGAMGLLLVFDPRTQAFWGERWSDAVDFVRAILGR